MAPALSQLLQMRHLGFGMSSDLLLARAIGTPFRWGPWEDFQPVACRFFARQNQTNNGLRTFLFSSRSCMYIRIGSFFSLISLLFFLMFDFSCVCSVVLTLKHISSKWYPEEQAAS